MSKYVQNLRQLAVIVAKKCSCQFYFTVKNKISDNFTVFFFDLTRKIFLKIFVGIRICLYLCSVVFRTETSLITTLLYQKLYTLMHIDLVNAIKNIPIKTRELAVLMGETERGNAESPVETCTVPNVVQE